MARMGAMTLYRLGNWCHRHHVPLVPQIARGLTLVLFGSVVPATAVIGKDTELGYRGLSVVIHARSVIGENCMVGPFVVIGGRSGHHDVPVIGDDVFIGAGAKILGPITIGDGAVIGANAVVIHDVPARAVAAGIPARIVREDVDVADYATLPRAL
jgi:serine O-acetyltransferase